MVRSILFTGDCPAARRVREKEEVERRQQQLAARQVAACEARHGDSGRSQNSMRKTTGNKVYAASLHPMKRAINEYLARLAECGIGEVAAVAPPAAGSQARAETWVLALETRDLLTVTAMGAAGFRPDHIVVPQPSQTEAEAMRILCPDLVVMELTSHELLQALEARTSPEHMRLTALGWPGVFGVVWLDYCGSFASGAGRQRQGDIKALISTPLISQRALVAVTLSQRGMPHLYQHDFVDLLVLLVRHLAERAGFVAQVSGVAAYKISAPMCTCAFLLTCTSAAQREGAGRDTPRADAMAKVAGPVGKNLTFFAGEWGVLRSLDAITPAAAAARRVAAGFASEVQRWTAPGARALVQDGRLLSVAEALLMLPPACVGKVSVAIADPLDAILAESMVVQGRFGACARKDGEVQDGLRDKHRLELVPASVHEVLLTPQKAAYECVWLGYEAGRPFAARELRECHLWQDLGQVFSSGLLNLSQHAVGDGVTGGRTGKDVAVLGVCVNYAPNCECWEDSAVDWLERGVQAAGEREGLHVETLRVFRYMLESPRMAIIFRVSRAYLSTPPEGTWPRSMPSSKDEPDIRLGGGFVTQEVADADAGGEDKAVGEVGGPCVRRWLDVAGWDRHRAKRPTGSGVKYLKVSAYVADLLDFLAGEDPRACASGPPHSHECGPFHVALHEPGFLHVLPALVGSEAEMAGGVAGEAGAEGGQGRKRVVCLTNDEIQMEALAAMSSCSSCIACAPQNHHDLGGPVLVGNRAAVLLEDRGLHSWLEMWGAAVKRWIASPSTSNSPTPAAVGATAGWEEAATRNEASKLNVRALVVMAEQTDKDAAAALQGMLSAAAAEVDLHVLVDEQSSVVCESRRFFVGSFLIGPFDATHALLTKWEAIRPPLMLHADSKRLRALRHPEAPRQASRP